MRSVFALLTVGILLLACAITHTQAGSESAKAYTAPPQPNLLPTALPNLKPYRPAGWSGSIVVSKVPGTHTDDFPITTDDTIYIDATIINDSSISIPAGTFFFINIYVDDQCVRATSSNGLPANAYIPEEDVAVGPLESGIHTISVCADCYGYVAESDEGDNCGSKPLGVDEGPEPDIRGEPQPIVLNREVIVVPGQSGQPMRLSGETAVGYASKIRAQDWIIRLKSRDIFSAENIVHSSLMKALPRENGKRHVLVQLSDIPNAKERQALEDQGVKLLSYVPNKAWFACLSADANISALQAAGVRFTTPILPSDKLSAAIRKRGAAPWSRNKDGTATVRVRFFKDVPPEAAQSAVSRVRGKIQEWAGKIAKVTLPAGRVNALAKQDEVQWIEDREPPKTTFNDLARQCANVDTVQVAPYWLTGSGVSIGIWDEGRVDSNHPDLSGRVVFGDSSNPNPQLHATHVAGTMAGTGTFSQSRGGTPFQWKGVAPGARIVTYDWTAFLSEYQTATITHCIVVSQNSWGYVIGYWPDAGEFLNNRDQFGDYGIEQAAFDDIIRGLYGRRVTICWAAGNDRDDCSPVYGCDSPTGYYCIPPPGTAKNMITVGAINSNDDSMTAFSSWGPTDDGRIKPEIVAAGCQVGGDQGTTSCGLSQSYTMMYGTSMACPVVSGCAALVMERFRNLAGQDPLPSTVKALLIQSAVDLGNPGPDYSFGYGKVNATGAIELLDNRAFREGVMVDSATAEYLMDVPAECDFLKATLAWDDAPGPENNSISLVNDLDIELEDPLGRISYPWVLDPSQPAQPATTGIDTRNVVEQILVNNPIPGEWKVRVKGTTVPESPQTYSVVCNHLTAQQTMRVHNDGSNTSGLEISSILKQKGSQWLSVAPTEFSVSVGEYQPVSVDIAAAGLEPGVYTDQLMINWNKPEGSQKPNPYPLPVELHVTARYQESSAGALKTHAPTTAVRLVSKVVTVGTDVLNDAFYMQEADRSSGIRVVPTPGTNVSAGDIVSVDGALAVQNGELSIVDSIVSIESSSNPLPPPLSMTTAAVGGGDCGYQEGVWAWHMGYNPESGGLQSVLSKAGGLNNVGLFIRVTGEISSVSDNTFYIKDGFNLSEGTQTPAGVRVVLCSGVLPPLSVGDYATVDGISACGIGPDDKPVRLLRAPRPSDINILR